jgi:hypothetical protein
MKSSIWIFVGFRMILNMDAFIRILASALVPLFLLGMGGSMLVVLVTVIRDLQEIFTGDDPTDS